LVGSHGGATAARLRLPSPAALREKLCTFANSWVERCR
jgi:hypothetical protein